MSTIFATVDRQKHIYKQRRTVMLKLLLGEDLDLFFPTEAHKDFFLAEILSPCANLFTEFFGAEEHKEGTAE